MDPTRVNTCCEGQGTRLLGSLPEHIYSLAPDGLYVNLFESSTVSWSNAGQPLQLKMATQFPAEPDVHLGIAAPQPVRAKIRIRVPSWATSDMALIVNGKSAAHRKSGELCDARSHLVQRRYDFIQATNEAEAHTLCGC